MSQTDTTTSRPRALVVLQLSGGNDFMNTVVPYGDGFYYDHRPNVGLRPDELIRIDDQFGFHPAMQGVKSLWDDGSVAIVNGVGYPDPNRTHFRSMDIWQTAEPARFREEGWLALAVRALDPLKHNVATAVSFGPGLPKALHLPGTPAMAVAQLEEYGFLRDLPGERQRRALSLFQRIYLPEEIAEQDMIYKEIGQLGADAIVGSEMLRTAPHGYEPAADYGSDELSQSLKAVAQVHLAGTGTRIFYAQMGGFDVHMGEAATQARLWTDASRAIASFFADLRAHEAAEEMVMLVFTEFGRTVKDDGDGTHHGSGGGVFLLGDAVRGGFYGAYPSLRPERLLDGDLQFEIDFRSVYATVLEDWLTVESATILGGQFEPLRGIFDGARVAV